MSVPIDPFRQFQEELAALDRKNDTRTSQAPEQDRMARAKMDFLAWRDRYQFSVADVVAFFPEKDGIDYLLNMIAASAAKPARGKRRSA